MRFSEAFFPVALAEKMAGRPLNDSTEADIVASFNSAYTDWHFDTTEPAPGSRTDFVTVILHEIAHGLGFIDGFLFDEDEGTGSWSNNSFFIYDRFIYKY